MSAIVFNTLPIMKAIADLLRCSRGSLTTLFGLALPVVMGAAALAVDSAHFYNVQGKMQSVADATALATAKELHLYLTKLDVLKATGKTHGEAMLAMKGLGDKPHAFAVTVNPAVNLIDVELSVTVDPLLPVGIWGQNPIRVRSRAEAYGQSKLCVLGLDNTKADTIKGSGGAIVTAPQCAVQSNSSDPGSLNLAADSSMTSTVICSSGGVKGGGTFEPSPQTDCPELDDPLSSRTPPSVGGCNYLDTNLPAGTRSISPGVYCGGLKLQAGAVVTAEPGVYIISGGPLEVAATASLSGEYVGFYFQDDPAIFNLKAGSTIDLKAPRDGPMAGLLFFQNPATGKDKTFTVNSAGARNLLGTIYLPSGILKIDVKGNVADLSAYTVIVAERIEIKSANLVVNADYGGTDVPVPEGVGPHSTMVRLRQ
jgi:hypothetical protein